MVTAVRRFCRSLQKDGNREGREGGREGGRDGVQCSGVRGLYFGKGSRG